MPPFTAPPTPPPAAIVGVCDANYDCVPRNEPCKGNDLCFVDGVPGTCVDKSLADREALARCRAMREYNDNGELCSLAHERCFTVRCDGRSRNCVADAASRRSRVAFRAKSAASPRFAFGRRPNGASAPQSVFLNDVARLE